VAVGADQTQVFQGVILGAAVDVVELKGDRLTKPGLVPAALTPVTTDLSEVLSQEPGRRPVDNTEV
jgi:hypothetical protein